MQDTSQLFLKLTGVQRQLIKTRENLQQRDEALVGMQASLQDFVKRCIYEDFAIVIQCWRPGLAMQSLLEAEAQLSKRLQRELMSERQLRVQQVTGKDATDVSSQAECHNAGRLNAYHPIQLLTERMQKGFLSGRDWNIWKFFQQRHSGGHLLRLWSPSSHI